MYLYFFYISSLYQNVYLQTCYDFLLAIYNELMITQQDVGSLPFCWSSVMQFEGQQHLLVRAIFCRIWSMLPCLFLFVTKGISLILYIVTYVVAPFKILFCSFQIVPIPFYSMVLNLIKFASFHLVASAFSEHPSKLVFDSISNLCSFHF